MLRGTETTPAGVIRLETRPNLPVHLLKTEKDGRRGLAMYVLEYDGRFIENPVAFHVAHARRAAGDWAQGDDVDPRQRPVWRAEESGPGTCRHAAARRRFPLRSANTCFQVVSCSYAVRNRRRSSRRRSRSSAPALPRCPPSFDRQDFPLVTKIRDFSRCPRRPRPGLEGVSLTISQGSAGRAIAELARPGAPSANSHRGGGPGPSDPRDNTND